MNITKTQDIGGVNRGCFEDYIDSIIDHCKYCIDSHYSDAGRQLPENTLKYRKLYTVCNTNILQYNNNVKFFPYF